MQIITKISAMMLLASVFTITAIMPRSAHATVVEIQTILGSFQVNLTDEATPVTVANFLTYVNDSSYTNSISHRSVPGFIVQAGGFAFDGITPIVDIESNDPIINEPLYSNLRGTIAMAKFDGDPNSATNQWFINLADNSAILDAQNGGFTVFGQVIGDGMEVVDAIAALFTFPFQAPFNEIPLIDYPLDAPTDDLTLLNETNLVIVNAVVVTDPTVDSAADLEFVSNTIISDLTQEQEDRITLLSENRATSMGLVWLMLLGLALMTRRHYSQAHILNDQKR